MVDTHYNHHRKLTNRKIQMKGKYFFIENRKEIEIQEFDYKYVQNALLKEFDRHATRTYCYTVVVKRTFDSLGNPEYDVRTLDLADIYYDNTELCVLKLMKDQICFHNVKIQDLPMPPLQKEYMDWKAGKIAPKQIAAPVTVEVPPPPARKRIDIAIDDPRLREIEEMETDKKIVPMEVLDWVVNMPIRAHEAGVNIQAMSEKQLNLSSALLQHSEYMNSLYSKLTNVLEQLFPLKPTFTQKLFGKTDVKVSTLDLNHIMQQLNAAVMYDTTKFEGVQVMFDELTEKVEAIESDLTQGIVGCEFQIARAEDSFEFDLMKERLSKMSIVNDYTAGDLVTMNKLYMIDVNRMRDIQTTTIPLIIMRLRKQVGDVVDSETIDIIRNLAYGKKK